MVISCCTQPSSLFFFGLHQLTQRHHVRVHIFNRRISDEPAISLGIKAEYLPIACVPLVNIWPQMVCCEMLTYFQREKLEKIQQTLF